MAQVRVDLGDRSYPIIIESGLIERLGTLVRGVLPRVDRALVISDTNVAPRYGAQAVAALEAAGISTRLAVVAAGEASKSLQEAYRLYPACVEAGLERSSVIVALGGGVVGDLAGFVAATYLRGISFVQVPTTLLAQVDSSIGGKTGVDLPQGKNLVGAFHQPRLVVSDLNTLTTLPHREIAAGMAEVVKHAVIRRADFLDYLESNVREIQAVQPAVVGRVVESNCLIKAQVVAADEREGGIRAILNFGHTVGHAVEAATGFTQWLHGECVAVGMVAATAIAREAGILRDPRLPQRLESLLQQLGLPVRLPEGLAMESLAPLMQRDKKVEAGRIRWVLPVRAGEVALTPEVPPEAVARALNSLRG